MDGGFDVACLFAVEDANGNRSRDLAYPVHECIGPPTIASPKKEPSYEKIGTLAGGEFVQRAVGLVRNTCRIDIHQMPEDRAVRRKLRGIYQYFFKRLFIVPS